MKRNIITDLASFQNAMADALGLKSDQQAISWWQDICLICGTSMLIGTTSLC